jgi:hypothetical protein
MQHPPSKGLLKTIQDMHQMSNIREGIFMKNQEIPEFNEIPRHPAISTLLIQAVNGTVIEDFQIMKNSEIMAVQTLGQISAKTAETSEEDLDLVPDLGLMLINQDKTSKVPDQDPEQGAQIDLWIDQTTKTLKRSINRIDRDHGVEVRSETRLMTHKCRVKIPI